MKEIIGNNIAQIVAYCGVTAKQTLVKTFDYGYMKTIEVWELDDDQFDQFTDKMDQIDDEKFEQLFDDAWWYCATGSNMGDPNSEYVVNGHVLLAWDGHYREDNSQEDYEEYVKDERECEVDESDIDSYEVWEAWYAPKKYSNIYEYMCEEIGASTERNTTSLLVDLAKANGLTMAQLLDKYI